MLEKNLESPLDCKDIQPVHPAAAATAATAATASVVSDSVRPHRWQPTRLPHPWDSPGKNTGVGQSILKEINSDYSLEGLMLRLKFQYFGHLMQRTDSLEKTAMLGKIEGRRRRGRQRRWLDGITDSMGMSLSKLQEIVKNREAWRVSVHEVAECQT